MSSKYIGNTYTSEAGQDFKVIGVKTIKDSSGKGHTSYYVKFIESGYETWTSATSISRQRIKDRLYPSLCGIGKIGYASITNNEKAYSVWAGMIVRCYDINEITHKKGASVCDRWHRFDYFLEDLPKVDGYVKEPFEKGLITLDRYKKQINTSDKIVYSLETCTFLTLKESHMYRKHKSLKSFIATSPDGETFDVTGIRQFAKKHNINHAGIVQCLNGKQKQCKGWKFSRTSK